MAHPLGALRTRASSGQAAAAGAEGPTPASPRHAARICAEPGCPERADWRGRCVLHRQTTTERGYGSDWQEFSLQLRRERGACEDCGSRVDLTVDHVDPHSGARGYRVRCRPCHAKYGAKGGTPDAPDFAPPITERPLMRVIG